MLAAIAIAPQFAVAIPRSVYLGSHGSRQSLSFCCPGPPSPTCRPGPVLPPGHRGPFHPPSIAVRCGTRATAPAVTPRILDGRSCAALPCPRGFLPAMRNRDGLYIYLSVWRSVQPALLFLEQPGPERGWRLERDSRRCHPRRKPVLFQPPSPGRPALFLGRCTTSHKSSKIRPRTCLQWTTRVRRHCQRYAASHSPPTSPRARRGLPSPRQSSVPLRESVRVSCHTHGKLWPPPP